VTIIKMFIAGRRYPCWWILFVLCRPLVVVVVVLEVVAAAAGLSVSASEASALFNESIVGAPAIWPSLTSVEKVSASW
jgi:hypothetical protein